MSHSEKAVQEMARSTCLKTQTGAVIVKDGEIIATGHNLCAPDGCRHGDPVCDCPRMHTPTGTGYELCQPIHAEVMACLNIRPNRDAAEYARFASHKDWTPEDILSVFTEEECEKLNGATLVLAGHYWVCDKCTLFLMTLGLCDVEYDRETGSETKDRYEKKGIT